MATMSTERSSGSRSTAEAQRARVVAHAVHVFARTGYHATPVTDVAAAAGISAAYIFRLFPGKLGLFVAAVEHCYDRMRLAMVRGAQAAEQADGQESPAEVLTAMGDAYVELIRDRDLLMLQVHAQSACEVPKIRQAVQRGLGDLVTTVSTLSGAPAAEVQRFIAYGLICQLVVTAGLENVADGWAQTLTTGIRHLDELGSAPPA